MTLKSALSFAAKAAVSVVILYLALRSVDFATLQDRLRNLHIGWYAVALALMTVQMFLTALRWRAIAIACGAPLGAGRAFVYSLIGAFFSQTLPSTVGGDAARIVLLSKDTGRWKGATYSVLVDRGAGLTWLALLVFACLPWSLAVISNPIGHWTLTLVGLAGLAIIPGLMLARLVGRRIASRWAVVRHLHEAADIACRCIVSRVPGVTVATSTIAVHLITVLAVWAIARSVDSSLPLGTALLLVPPVILIAAVPVSIAGWGVREGAMVTAFTYAGLPASDGLLVSLAFGICAFLLGAAGGVLWLARRQQTKPAPSAPAVTSGDIAGTSR